MNDPWQILTLDPRTATERDVKAAYARMLKLHRPDSDPEGFQRVRGAYTDALEWLKQKTRVDEDFPEDISINEPDSQPHDDDQPSISSLSEPASAEQAAEPPQDTAPPEIADCLASIAQRLDQTEDTSRNALSAAFTKLSTETLRLQFPAPLVCRLLHKAVGGKADPVAQFAQADFLLYLLRGGESQILFEVVKNWERNRSMASAVMFAMAVERSKFQPSDEEAAMVLAHVARIIGFYHSNLGNLLANGAYPHLPRDARESIMGILEQQIALGKLFFGFPPEMQRFWQQRLNQREEDEEVNWHSDEALDAMRYVVQNRGHSWEGLGLIQQLVPAEIWTAAEATLSRQVSKVQKSQQEARGGSGSYRWVWILFILGANLARMANTGSSHSSSSSDFRAPTPARTAQQVENGFSKNAEQHRQVIQQGRPVSPFENTPLVQPPKIQFESKLTPSMDVKTPPQSAERPLTLPNSPPRSSFTPSSPPTLQPTLTIDPKRLLNMSPAQPNISLDKLK